MAAAAGPGRIDRGLAEAGTYRVLVTSYETGESGPYSLTIDPSGDRTAPTTRDVTTLAVGAPGRGAPGGPAPPAATARAAAAPARGELDGDDSTFEAGEYHDAYVFDGAEGDTVRVELSSTDFDTYLGLVTPSGEEIANDDYAGAADRSVIELTLPETGRYRVQATSHAAAES